MIIILKTIIKYNIPKVYSEIIDIYPKEYCILYINFLLIFKKNYCKNAHLEILKLFQNGTYI
jgi:hypothetical protein